MVRESRDDWNRWLGRIEVEGGSEAQKVKFYTDLWHALLGRRIVSDANGHYCDMTGPEPVIAAVSPGPRRQASLSRTTISTPCGAASGR